MDDMMPGHGLFGLAVLAMAVLGYFLPAVVAYSRRHHNRLAILALNWSGILNSPKNYIGGDSGYLHILRSASRLSS